MDVWISVTDAHKHMEEELNFKEVGLCRIKSSVVGMSAVPLIFCELPAGLIGPGV